MAVARPVPPVEETLAWEAQNRSRVGLASVAAGVLLFGTFLYAIAGFGDSPNVTLTDGLRNAVGQPLADGRTGLLTAKAMWYDDHTVILILITVLSAIGTALIAMVLGYLYRALEARRPTKNRLVLYFGLVGPILYGVGPLISVVTVSLQSGDYVSHGVFSTLGAHDAISTGSGIVFAQVAVLLGQLATAAAVIFVSLWAMQVGLLTRFLGILGIIVGALLLLPAFFGPPAIIQTFWLLALGLMLLGVAGTLPPAWVAGEAIPWPSQQQLREQQAELGDTPASAPVTVTEDAADGAPRAAGTKRKRKRR